VGQAAQWLAARTGSLEITSALAEKVNDAAADLKEPMAGSY